MSKAITWFGALTALAALWTGYKAHFAIGYMTGFFPPHYGYSAYIESAALLLAGWTPIGYLCGFALLLSNNRDAWLGVVAGWAYLGNKHRRAACVILGALAIIVGAQLKPHNYNDSARLGIWKTVIEVARENPHGLDMESNSIYYAGKRVTKAHSDVLQGLLEYGFVAWALVMFEVSRLLYLLLKGIPTPMKAVLLCLTVQSVFDNRLHHPACFILYGAVAFSAAVNRANKS